MVKAFRVSCAGQTCFDPGDRSQVIGDAQKRMRCVGVQSQMTCHCGQEEKNGLPLVLGQYCVSFSWPSSHIPKPCYMFGSLKTVIIDVHTCIYVVVFLQPRTILRRIYSQSSLLSSLRQRRVAVINSRYLPSISSKMCFLSKLTGSGVKRGPLRSASNLQCKNTHVSLEGHKAPGLYYIFNAVL